MIAYYGRFGNYLGQASAVPPEAPLTRVPAPATPALVPVVPAPSIADEPVAPRYEDKVTLTKAGLVVGAIALAVVAISLSGALAKR